MQAAPSQVGVFYLGKSKIWNIHREGFQVLLSHLALLKGCDEYQAGLERQQYFYKRNDDDDDKYSVMCAHERGGKLILEVSLKGGL